jgi:hypothetical protein
METCGVVHPTIEGAACISPADRTAHVQHFWRPAAFGAQPVYWPNEHYQIPFRTPLKPEVRKGLRKLAGQVKPPARARVSDPPSAHTAAALIEPTAGACKARVLAHLEAHRGQWVGGMELQRPETGGDQGLKRVRELRQEGYDIENRPTPGSRGTWQYRLR